MKKAPKWAPRFDERLRQSKNTKTVPLKKAQGLRLYYVYEDVEVEYLEPYVRQGVQGYSVGTKKVTMVERVNSGIKWLKPKHITLLRMQGKSAVEVSNITYTQTQVDIESY